MGRGTPFYHPAGAEIGTREGGLITRSGSQTTTAYLGLP
jgi:hypothetical protein